MLKKVIMLSTIVVLSMALISGCGSSSEFGGDPLHDKSATKNAVTKMKEKAGTPLVFFQSVIFHNDVISFNRQDQKNPENIEKFTWSEDGGWQVPKAITIEDEDIADSTFSVDEINWQAIPDFVSAIEKKAKAEGMGEVKVDGILIEISMSDGNLVFKANVKSDKKMAFAQGDVKTGEIISFSDR